MYKCVWCCIHVGSSIVSHSRIHSGEKPYKCHMCDKAFSASGSLNTHMRVHTGDKRYKCLLCNKSFGQSSQLQSHKRHIHSNRRPYHCPYCGKLFKTNSDLKRHVRIHTGAKPYSCRHCSESFRRTDQLKTHLLKSHSEGTWFLCNACRYKCVTLFVIVSTIVQNCCKGRSNNCRKLHFWDCCPRETR